MVRKKPPKGCPLPMPADLRHFVEGRLDRCLEMDNLKVGFGCKEYAHISAATPPTCSGSCRNCSNQYLPLQWQNLDGYSEQLTDDEAREMIRQFTAKTRVDLAYIRESLSTYGNAIVKRWQKRNTEKRAALLRKAMPEIYKDKWLEARSCDGFRTYSVFTSADVPARKCWLLPYVNVEALSQDWTKILALMHARVTYEPADWIAHDIDCQQHGFDSAWLDVGYNPHCVVVEASGFGQLTQWGMERAHKWEIMGFPRARLAFEAQSELSGFLSTMIKLLLGETGNQTPQGNSQWLALATTDFDDSTSGAIADSAYYNRAFSAPYRFDAGRIMNLLRARCDAAKDELWMLQRDPRHFRERLACAQATPYYRQLPQREKKRHLVRQTLSPVDHVHITQSVVEEVSLLIDVLNAHGGKSGQSVPLSKDCENVLRLLSGTFAGQFMTQVTALYEMTIQSSAFQHHISRDADGEVQYLTSPADAFRTDKLFWNIMKLGEVNLCSTHKPAFHLAYIDELLGKGSGPERERIGRVLYDHLSDMACVDECLTIVQSYRPCLGPFPNKETPLVLGLKYGLVQQVGVLEKLLMSWDALDSAEVLLQEPLEEFLVLPMPSTKANRETLMRTEELHHALYKYWTALTTYKRKNLKRLGFQEQDAARLVKSTSMGSTDEYRRGLAEELDGLRSAVEAKERTTQARKGQPTKKLKTGNTANTAWPATPERQQITTPEPKVKQKTRPAPGLDAALSEVHLDHTEHEPVQQRPIIEVGLDSLYLFRRMFSSYATSKSTASVRWDDFVAALRDAGCSARHNGGSAVAFTHPSAATNLVVIHRPHPDPTINPILLRSCGRKVEKRFQWDVDTFVEREKERK